MQKIISLFKRDYEAVGARLVYNEVVEGAEWVQAGEGVATRKLDGACCMIRGDALFKRHDFKKWKGNKVKPDGWEPAQPEPDQITGHWPGWLRIGDGPEDKWHREAFIPLQRSLEMKDGTYELVGPKVQGNPEGMMTHTLIAHGNTGVIEDAPRSFGELREWFKVQDIEGIVWHHPDGRMVKIKKKDFGLQR